MSPFVLLLVLSSTLVYSAAASHLNTVNSELWVSGTRYTVTFTAGAVAGSDFSVTTPPTAYTFALHALPIDLTANPASRCNVSEIGASITERFMFSHEAQDINIPLPIPMLAFRSLVVYNGSTRVGCGNILPTGNLLTSLSVLKAVFINQVGGAVYVIQSEEDTYIIGKLYSTTSPMSANYTLGSFPFVGMPANGTCPVESVTGVTISNSVSVQEMPASYSEGAFYVYSSSLRVSTLANSTLALTTFAGFFSCAILRPWGDVGTSVGSPGPMLTQLLPYTYAFVASNAIRQYEVYTDAQNPGVACVDRTVYDPLGAGSVGSAPADIPIGDLPRKGSLTPNSIPEVPTMGPYTIVGHRLNDSNCGFLRPASTKLERVIMATVTFDDVGINGTMVFRQLVFEGGVLGPTFITQGAYYGDGRTATTGHNWHVHLRRRAEDKTCSIVGGHYNPFNVNLTQPAYGTACSSASQFRCEMGDQAGKHGRLTVDSMSEPEVLYDEHLQLAGPFTILGRSIVIHLPSGPIMTCANIEAAILSDTVITVKFPKLNFEPTDIDFRFSVANMVADRAGVARGDVLVYEASDFNVSSTQCLNVILRTTGRDLAAANQNAQAVMGIDVQTLQQFSQGGICGTAPSSSGFSPKMSAVVMVVLALVAFLFA